MTWDIDANANYSHIIGEVSQNIDSLVGIRDETNNNFGPNTNTNNIRFSKSTEYEYE